MTTHPCPFCRLSFLVMEKLVSHLWEHNPTEVVAGNKKLRFAIRRDDTNLVSILCFCGQRFSANFLAAPAFREWAIEHTSEYDSFLAHLKRNGGCKKHFHQVKAQALLGRIERSANGG